MSFKYALHLTKLNKGVLHFKLNNEQKHLTMKRLDEVKFQTKRKPKHYI